MLLLKALKTNKVIISLVLRALVVGAADVVLHF
jgi:hypothetical protein